MSLRRALSALSLALGLSAGSAGAAAAQSVAPEAAPAEWIAYATTVNAAVTGWLGGEEEGAVRLRTSLDAARPAVDQPSPPIQLKLWIDGRGAIERAEFPPFADETANADLRGLLVGREVGSPPPRDLLLPLRLEVQLAPTTVEEPTPAAG